MLNVKPGDKLFVVIRQGRGGQTRYPAVVGRVRRTLFEVVCERAVYSGDYRLENGYRNGESSSGYGPTYVITPEEADKRDRRVRALDTLVRARIRLDYGHALTLDQVEQLAAVVAGWQDEECGS